MTAIDFLLEKITFKKLEHDIYLYPRVSIKDIEEAKEMEKQQIIDAYTHDRVLFQITAEKYFNETFKTNKMKNKETLEEAVENRIRGINVNTGFNK